MAGRVTPSNDEGLSEDMRLQPKPRTKPRTGAQRQERAGEGAGGLG